MNISFFPVSCLLIWNVLYYNELVVIYMCMYGFPLFVFFDSDGGEELANELFYGYQDAEEFFDTLELIAD